VAFEAVFEEGVVEFGRCIEDAHHRWHTLAPRFALYLDKISVAHVFR
jgi:hypothetical protein